MTQLLQKQIGELVAQDYRTAAIFSNYGIDFCCKGDRQIEEVCTKKKINAENIEAELKAILNASATGEPDYKQWPLDLLADYVEKTHHRYVESKSQPLLQFLDKLCKVHGERHPELFKINTAFKELAQEMASHMKKEELILFPFIKKLVQADLTKTEVSKPHFGSVENPIDMMEHEHETAGNLLRIIEKETSGYQPPADACNTYRVTFAMLKEFEEDLHKHIHLENNILFPKSIVLEKRLNVSV